MSGISYSEFYSLPQWTPNDHAYSYPLLQEQPCIQHTQQYPRPDVQLPNQWQYNLVNHEIIQPIRRKRASKPKVRTGCSTCKVRRVKCDEKYPACLRCTSTGRKCDGYQFPRKDPTARSADVSASNIPPSSLPPPSADQVAKRTQQIPKLFTSSLTSQTPLNQVFKGTVQEHRAFHRFKYRTIPAFAGGSETGFWTGLVLRAATSEPVIREAVIALGSLHEDYEACGGIYNQSVITSSTSKNTAFLYGRAIRNLYKRIDTITGETANLAVVASILFACFEVLRRNDMAAVMHYQNGMRQLMKQMTESQNGIEDTTTLPAKDTVVQSTPKDDLDRMLRVFARYDIQACTFSKAKVEVLSVELPKVPPNEVGLTEVRMYLDNLLIAVYQLVKSDLSMFRYWKSEEVAPAWLEKRDEALVTFQGWLDVLEKSIPSDAVTLRNHGISASKSILGLILQIRIAMIMLRTCIDCGPETTFDQFTPQFDEMVARVENMTNILGLDQAAPLDHETVPFSMELGVIHPLFFIAWKCRDWRIRRRAIAEMKKCGKEGVWEGPIMGVVAQRIMQIEEQGLQDGEAVPEESRVHDLRKGVEYDERVVRAEIRLAQDSTWKNWSVLREAIPF